jgi:hypothetical protein
MEIVTPAACRIETLLDQPHNSSVGGANLDFGAVILQPPKWECDTRQAATLASLAPFIINALDRVISNVAGFFRVADRPRWTSGRNRGAAWLAGC